jgi:O-antigen ligase
MNPFETVVKNQKSGFIGNLSSSGYLAEMLFLISLVSIFFPTKIYPAVFLVSCFFFYRDTAEIRFPKWAIALAIYSAYACTSYVFYSGEISAGAINILKLLINFSFLFFTVNWLAGRDNKLLIRKLDTVLLVVLALSLLQIVVYHQAYDFQLLAGSTSSGQASSLYRDSLYYWGLDDKNMFGARIALLGFAYICIPITKNQLSVWRIVFVFLIAFLSLSRTPLVALFIGVFFLIWISVSRKWKILAFVLVVLSLPLVLQKFIRIDSLTSSNDGMGIRITYWKAFFLHFGEISPLGNGFGSTPEFLRNYADYYRGEPHIHSTFLSNYLELGIFGFFSFLAFLSFYIQACLQKGENVKFWTALFLPLLSIMMILYSGYDNDVVMYLCLIFLIGSVGKVNFHTLKFTL